MKDIFTASLLFLSSAAVQAQRSALCRPDEKRGNAEKVTHNQQIKGRQSGLFSNGTGAEWREKKR